MAELKTKPTDGDVGAFLEAVADPVRRADAIAVRELLDRVTGEQAVLWGSDIVGYGHRHLRYGTGRELDWFEVGFSPRKQATTLYVFYDVQPYADLLARLGKHSVGRSCLYVKRLSDVDLGVLAEIVARSLDRIRAEG
ncbi:MAG: DUF1801 domain-containing protein [Kineosporiaceae bacterium]|jgi:hypothetical protein